MDGRPARAGNPCGAHGLGGKPSAADRGRGGRASNASFGRMTTNELAASYRRYNACRNEHRFEDLARVRRARREDRRRRPGTGWLRRRLRAVLRAFPDYGWALRRLVVDPPWIAAHVTEMGTHGEAFRGVQATGRSVAVPEFAFCPSMPAGSPRCGARPSTCISLSSCGSGCRHLPEGPAATDEARPASKPILSFAPCRTKRAALSRRLVERVATRGALTRPRAGPSSGPLWATTIGTTQHV
jgi:predicted ester cyclase